MQDKKINILLCPNCGTRLMYLMPSGRTLCCNKCDKCFVNDNGEVGKECDDPYTEDDVIY